MPLQYTRYYAPVKLWLKILQSDNKKYIKSLYKILNQDILDKHNARKWCSLLRDMLFTLGFADTWYLHYVGNKNKLFLKGLH